MYLIRSCNSNELVCHFLKLSSPKLIMLFAALYSLTNYRESLIVHDITAMSEDHLNIGSSVG